MPNKKENLLRTSPQALAAMTEQENPDVLNFSATVAFLDTPTDATPCGGFTGFSTVIASENLDVSSLVGSGVNVAYSDWWAGYNFKGHDKHNKVGVIDKAWVEGSEVKVEGHIWKSDFPDIADTIECAKESMGASVEVYFEGLKTDKTAKTVTGLNGHFTGVALLYKSKAAFKKTSIMCSAMEDTEGEEELMNEEMKQALAEQSQAFEEKLNAAVEKMTGMVEALSAKPEPKADPEPKEAPAAEQDFSAVSEAVAKAIADGFAGLKEELGAKPEPKVEEPKRKTEQDFSGIENPNHADKKKSLQELSAEIDADTSLTPAQKWSKQMALWQSRDAE